MDDNLLTVDELCEWLKVTRKTTERWRKDGMPYLKIGRTVRFDKTEVVKWIEEKQKSNKK